jgi:hypothetical protein
MDWLEDEHEGLEVERPAACILCSAMLPEAVDGVLTETEQARFDAHVAGCSACALELEEAQRGAAWLSMLKSRAPEPPADLLAKILASTSGAYAEPVRPAASLGAARPVAAPADWSPRWIPAAVPVRSGWSAVRERMAAMFTIDASRVSFQPRLAMTAAMAFFSVALTLNLTGVRLRNLRAEDLTPSGIRRSVADVSASMARSFANNRSVYQVESRLSELGSSEANDSPQPEGGSGR